MSGKLLSLTIGTICAVAAGAQTLVDSFPSPESDPRGLAWDGEYLWCSDAKSDSVYQLDPYTGEKISGFPFDIQDRYGGITWSSDGNVWIANGSYVYKVNPATGEGVDGFSCPGG